MDFLYRVLLTEVNLPPRELFRECLDELGVICLIAFRIAINAAVRAVKLHAVVAVYIATYFYGMWRNARLADGLRLSTVTRRTHVGIGDSAKATLASPAGRGDNRLRVTRCVLSASIIRVRDDIVLDHDANAVRLAFKVVALRSITKDTSLVQRERESIVAHLTAGEACLRELVVIVAVRYRLAIRSGDEFEKPVVVVGAIRIENARRVGRVLALPRQLVRAGCIACAYIIARASETGCHHFTNHKVRKGRDDLVYLVREAEAVQVHTGRSAELALDERAGGLG